MHACSGWRGCGAWLALGALGEGGGGCVCSQGRVGGAGGAALPHACSSPHCAVGGWTLHSAMRRRGQTLSKHECHPPVSPPPFDTHARIHTLTHARMHARTPHLLPPPHTQTHLRRHTTTIATTKTHCHNAFMQASTRLNRDCPYLLRLSARARALPAPVPSSAMPCAPAHTASASSCLVHLLFSPHASQPMTRTLLTMSEHHPLEVPGSFSLPTPTLHSTGPLVPCPCPPFLAFAASPPHALATGCRAARQRRRTPHGCGRRRRQQRRAGACGRWRWQ